MKFLNVYLTLGFILSLVICTIINTWLGVGLLIGAMFGFTIAVVTLCAQYIKDKDSVIKLLDDFDNSVNN